MQQDFNFSYEQLQNLHNITSLVLNFENDFDVVLKSILEILHSGANLHRGIISIYYEEAGEISHDTYGFDSMNEEVIYYPGEGITGKVVESGEPIIIPHLDEASGFSDKTGIRRELNTHDLAFICVPILYREKTIGALSVDTDNKEGRTDLSPELHFLERVAGLISEIIFKKKLQTENDNLREILKMTSPTGTIVGNSKVMKEVAYQISLIAESNVSVLITGETGTGKELVAKEIHNLSSRKENPFITVNCGAIPEGLIESELFGHKKGAFTGASDDRIGKFEAAQGGTIFLDEIGELPLMLQVKLLRVLQERQIVRVGDNATIDIDVRVITATNRNLEEEIEAGRFRSDLFYRLNVFQLYLPSLKERGADILLLADYFVRKYSASLNVKINRIETSAIDLMMRYHWPGNVRELENCIERACLLAREEKVIRSHHLPPSLQWKTLEDRGKKRGKFESLVRAYEIELITSALKDADGNQTRAAELLETTKRVIQYKISQYGIKYKRYSRTK